MSYIGANIRRERIKAGFDQMRLAHALGLGQTTISRFENGSRHPSVELLKKIAVELGCSFSALVNEEHEGNGDSVAIVNERIYHADDETKNFVETLLAQNPEIGLQTRIIAERSNELAPEDWQFLADHLVHAFWQVELLLNRKKK